MKKIIVLILALTLCLSLCACGEPQVIEKEVEKIVEVIPDEYEQFKDVVDALVKEEYDSAHALIEDLKPIPEIPPFIEVTITSDNFFEYFELLLQPEFYTFFEEGQNGEPLSVAFIPCYSLKEEYSIAKERKEDCLVEVGLKYAVNYYNSPAKYTIDFDSLTFTPKGFADSVETTENLVLGEPRETEDGSVSYIVFFGPGPGYFLGNTNSMVINEEDVEFISASGTLYLYE